MAANSYAALLKRLFADYERKHTMSVIEEVAAASRDELAGQARPGRRTRAARTIGASTAHNWRAVVLQSVPIGWAPRSYRSAQAVGRPTRPRFFIDYHDTSRVSVCQCTYSVPARFAGRRLTVWLGASTIEVLDGATTVAWHERAVGKFLDVLTLDHHLEVLKTKPGALPGATALVQGRRSGVFTSLHQACRDAARAAKGDACGTRWLIEVLLAHRTHLAAELIVAMDRACHAHSAARPS